MWPEVGLCTNRKDQVLYATTSRLIDNDDSGYLGMAVQLYGQAHLGHYHILSQKEYSQKLMAQLNFTPLLTYVICDST